MRNERVVCPKCGASIQTGKNGEVSFCPACGAQMGGEEHVLIQYEAAHPVLVWKHPSTDFDSSARLLVREGQQAVVLRNGEALAPFPAGLYAFGNDALPKIDELFAYRAQADGEKPHMDVFFISLSMQMGLRWGTSSRIQLLDPASGLPVEIGASGSFGLRVTDSSKLIARLVGASDGLRLEALIEPNGGWFRRFIMEKARALLAEYIVKNALSVLSLDERLDEISKALKEAVNEVLAPYGMAMPVFSVSAIALSEEDGNVKRLKQMRAEGALAGENPAWRCSCGRINAGGNFCPACGAKKL